MIPQLMPFQDQPFNGDTFICEEFLRLKNHYFITSAIETGSCLYSTTKWLGENFEKVYTAEINLEFANYGRHKIENMPNVSAIISDSVSFLYLLRHKLQDERCIFFLDAHWGHICPLKDELTAIAELRLTLPPIITIHDFKTNNPELGYDEYNGQPFEIDWILDEIGALNYYYNDNYTYHFNTEAVGAKRGIIYLCPQS